MEHPVTRLVPSARWLSRSAAFFAGLLTATGAAAVLSYTASISDPTFEAKAYYPGMLAAVGASFESWSSYIPGSADLSIEIEVTNRIPRATGASVTSGFVRNDGRYDIFEQGAAFEIRTGVDPNGPAPDIRIQVNPDYVAEELWFDPEPSSRRSEVAPDRTDAVSVFLHELGHAFAFNGWGDLTTGELRSDFASPWDVLTFFDGQSLFFDGASAVHAYGGPVPMTAGNNFHLGNQQGPGSDLLPDLMNGLVFLEGTRYSISTLDLAMMRDMGVAVAVPAIPEPETYGLLLAGLGCMAATIKRRSRERRRPPEEVPWDCSTYSVFRFRKRPSDPTTR